MQGKGYGFPPSLSRGVDLPLCPSPTYNSPTFSGIVVSNTPGAVDDATATTALYLIVSALRQFARAEQNLRAESWKSGLKPAHDPSGKTLAIIGLGGIALRLVELVHPFGMRILYHSRHPNPNAPKECEYFPDDRVNEMYAQADILSVHVPLRKETEGFVNESIFSALKPGAVLINTARGKVVDEAAMIRALESGQVRSPLLFSFKYLSPIMRIDASSHSQLTTIIHPHSFPPSGLMCTRTSQT